MEIQLYKNIISNPDVCNGKPVFKGTRITVKTIMEFMMAGDTEDEILAGYPRLEHTDLEACREFTGMLYERPVTAIPVK